MKKPMVICLVLIFVFFFSSCSSPQNNEDDIISYNLESNTEQEGGSVETAKAGSFEGGTADDQGAEACLLVYSFGSLNDFLLYCSSGSTDVSIYEQPPKDGVPKFKMKEKAVIDFWGLFPQLDQEAVTFDYVEVLNDHRYSYGGITNNAHQTEIGFLVGYEEDAADYSFESVIKKLESEKDLIVQGDFDDTETDLPLDVKSIANVLEKNGCILVYPKYRKRKSGGFEIENQGVAIYYKKYYVQIGPCYPADTTFYEDDTLIPILTLFKDGEERTQTLEGIKHYLDSKLENK